MRESAQYVKANLSGPFTIAEVGVSRGGNAIDMLEGLDVAQLYLVDPFLAYVDNGTVVTDDNYTANQESQDEAYQELLVNITPHLSKVTINKKASPEAANDYPDSFFDYVYIDGCHFEGQVEEDIKAWYNKVKAGGVLGGHDYIDCHGSDPYSGVTQAVQAFASKNNLTIISSSGPGGTDWFIQK